MDKFLRINEKDSSTVVNSIDSDSGSEVTFKTNEKEKGVKRSKTISAVWQYFKKSSDRKVAKCLQCGNEYKTSGNTSNLREHLHRMHPQLDDKSECSNSSTTSSSQASLTSFFRKNIEYADSSQRKKNIDTALSEFVAEYYQPFNIVNNDSFKNLLALLDPRYKLPSKNTLKNVLIKERYNAMKSSLFNILKNIENVAVTSDGWTSAANESYLAITAHFIDLNFTPRTAVLSTKKMIESTNHGAVNIANSIREVLTEWEIFDKISCIVTDNASNMKLACEILRKKHLPCFAHTLNLVVQNALAPKEKNNLNDKMSEIINKCKKIVNFFKSSTIATEKLKEAQKSENPLKVIQEVATRWNSSFLMIDRILQLKNEIASVMLLTSKAPAVLTADEIEILTEVQKILKPFLSATEQLSGNGVTCSLPIPITHGLHNRLVELNEQLVTDVGRNLCKNLLNGILQRLFFYETRTPTRIATLLDPRFKKEAFKSQENAAQASLCLENEIINLNQNSEEISVQTETSIQDDASLFSFMDKRIAEKGRTRKVDAILIKRQYFERENSRKETDPLEFWKVMESDFTPLRKCAIKYMCVPATSCESERTFSTAGQIVSKKRSLLKDKNVNMLVFLSKNKWVK